MQKMFFELKNLDKSTFKIMKNGLFFCSLVTLISISILLTYIFMGFSFLYYLGITLIKSSFIFAVEFIICGIVVDFIKKRDL